MEFTGQVAIVTGAGTGLGRAHALWLAERGAAVVVNNRAQPGRASTAEAVAEEIRAAGGRAVANEHAVEDPVAGRAMVEAAIAAFGRIDILVLNAGVHSMVPFHDLDIESFRRQVDINLWGSVYPVHAAWKAMVEQGYGRIVLTSSLGGIYGFPMSVPYATSKASILGLARGLALDVPAGADIRVNTIAPGGNTRMLAGLVPEAVAEALDPQRVSAVVGWLASRACDLNGAVLSVGGGRALRIHTGEGPVVDVPADGGAIDLAVLNDTRSLDAPAGVPESLGKLLPAEVAASLG